MPAACRVTACFQWMQSLQKYYICCVYCVYCVKTLPKTRFYYLKLDTARLCARVDVFTTQHCFIVFAPFQKTPLHSSKAESFENDIFFPVFFCHIEPTTQKLLFYDQD